jgi:two-component system osmolarity sensor histidine kinase EnvZ
VIEVWEQGEGIPEERRERALQPFQRLDEARGIHVVDQHGGKVQFLRRRSESRHPSNQNETPGEFAATINIPIHR